jgi:hypothetical protein
VGVNTRAQQIRSCWSERAPQHDCIILIIMMSMPRGGRCMGKVAVAVIRGIVAAQAAHDPTRHNTPHVRWALKRPSQRASSSEGCAGGRDGLAAWARTLRWPDLLAPRYSRCVGGTPHHARGDGPGMNPQAGGEGVGEESPHGPSAMHMATCPSSVCNVHALPPLHTLQLPTPWSRAPKQLPTLPR